MVPAGRLGGLGDNSALCGPMRRSGRLRPHDDSFEGMHVCTGTPTRSIWPRLAQNNQKIRKEVSRFELEKDARSVSRGIQTPPRRSQSHNASHRYARVPETAPCCTRSFSRRARRRRKTLGWRGGGTRRRPSHPTTVSSIASSTTNDPPPGSPRHQPHDLSTLTTSRRPTHVLDDSDGRQARPGEEPGADLQLPPG